MLLAVLLYGYCTGVRSSHQIERRCHEDIAFRILAGNRTPDHVTIARFRVRHEQALAGLLIQSLKLCAAAGLVRLGLVTLDGTKIEANAAAANRTHATSRPKSPSCSSRQLPSTRPRITAVGRGRSCGPGALWRASQNPSLRLRRPTFSCRRCVGYRTARRSVMSG
jgi:hypothetical protein